MQVRGRVRGRDGARKVVQVMTECDVQLLSAYHDGDLTDAERADLVAFLKGLDCPGSLEPPAAQ